MDVCKRSLMYYGGYNLTWEKTAERPETMHMNPLRLYGLSELTQIMAARGMILVRACGNYDSSLVVGKSMNGPRSFLFESLFW